MNDENGDSSNTNKLAINDESDSEGRVSAYHLMMQW